jgi:hypothetical protein
VIAGRENPFVIKSRIAHGREQIRRWSPGDRIRIRFSTHGSAGPISGDEAGTVITDREDWISIVDAHGVRSDFHPVQITDTEAA